MFEKKTSKMIPERRETGRNQERTAIETKGDKKKTLKVHKRCRRKRVFTKAGHLWISTSSMEQQGTEDKLDLEE